MEGTMATIIMFAGNFAPRNWAYCQGQLLAISANTALFSLLGTTYGGDGRTTFALPDLRGRVPVGTGHGPGLPDVILGETGGSNTVTLNVQEMPAHNHVVSPQGNSGNGDDTNPTGRFLATAGTDLYADAHNVSMGAATCTNTGGNQPHNNMQPFLGMNYVICMQGVYPSRS